MAELPGWWNTLSLCVPEFDESVFQLDKVFFVGHCYNVIDLLFRLDPCHLGLSCIENPDEAGEVVQTVKIYMTIFDGYGGAHGDFCIGRNNSFSRRPPDFIENVMKITQTHRPRN